METALLSLFSLVFIVFAFGIGVAVSALRAIFEAVSRRIAFLPDKIEGIFNDIWKEWVLPASPVLLGALAAFLLKDYPFPSDFAGSASGRVFFGIIAGFFSSFVYRFAKFHIKKYMPENIKKKVDGLAKRISLKPPPTSSTEEEPNTSEETEDSKDQEE